MNTSEAQELLTAELKEYERKSFAELVSLISDEFHYEKQGPSGVHYQLEIRVLWDSKPGSAIRVMGSIDDGGWRAFFPLTESFLKYPSQERWQKHQTNSHRIR